ncbi:6-phosphogluconolactonase [Aquiflexum sp. TKW24L]|uniref:6-phosphogluconolactonase n=1 Tax=Aquiflexum sp. TKW24L TaxID=2942212 RepID=UPI0020BD844D|nr:6-phosphogluconolactonase [Aquiflexum sp. TKW24L]MCL6259294.1 6-phosphogluconolactonase [Aquiflexum sp. TKW24L]
MKITYLENYDSLSQYAAKLVMDEVQLKRDLLFCAATGNSPTGMYAEMAKNKSLFDRMRVVKMDEWGIIPLSHPDSCESYIKKHVLEPLEIPAERYVGFDTAPESVAAECTRMQNFISDQEPFDICILGLGKNAHIAFNEPADFLQPYFHKAVLAPSTIQHDPALSQGPEPAYGLCVGMKDILETRKIIFLITGKGKQEAIKQILDRKISTQCPASFLWMHPNVECLIDKNSL